MAMFMKAAAHITKISGEKTLHAVTDLNTAEQFKPLCIVERKKSFWFWKEPTMTPTFVKIKDLLSKDINLSASKKQFTLLKDFEEVPSLEMSGSISAKILSEANVELKADEKLNLVLKLGDIEKTEVSWQQLSDALKDNPVNRDHPLYLCAKQHPSTSFCVVIGTISTKDDGLLKEDKALSLSTEGTVNVSNLSIVTAEIHASTSIGKKLASSFTIPPDTVLAYSCVQFSISPCGGLITLHSTFDTFDDTEAPAILAPADPDSKDGPPIVADANVRDPIITIKAEYTSLIQSEQFEEIKNEIILLISSAAKNNTFELMHSLLYRSVQYLENNECDADNFILMSKINDLLEDDKELPWKMVMTYLGFSIPKDGSNDNAFVVLPGNHDNDTLIKACMGLVDAIMDINPKARQLLPDICVDHVKIILNIIEMQLQDKPTFLKDLVGQSVKDEDSSTLTFLKECGFLILGDDQIIDFAGDKSCLLDTYIVLFVLFAKNK